MVERIFIIKFAGQMLNDIRRFFTVIAMFVMACGIAAVANTGDDKGEVKKKPAPWNILAKMAQSEKIPLDSTVVCDKAIDEKVIVGGDTVSIILPQKNYGRYDRGLLNYLYIPKGQWSFGMQASYGEFDTDNFQLLSIIKDFNVKVKAYSLQPSVSYFFGNNQSIGINFNYTRMFLDLGGLTMDFSDDINFTLSDVSYYSKLYTTSIAYRNYIGLSRDRRFGVFNEVEMAFGAGSARFIRNIDGKPRDTKTTTMTASLNFSPGVSVFIMDYVCFNVSFGVFGINVHKERQVTDGVDEGTRFSSGANFRFNVFNINFGMSVYI